MGESTTFTYDAEGNLLSLTDPENNTTSYTYDEIDRLTKETNSLGNTHSYNYDAVGNLITSVDRNGRTRQFNYDDLDRNTSEVWLDGNGSPIYALNYTYDAASQLTSIEDPNSAYRYNYDNAGRLTQTDNLGTPDVPNVVLNYAYDRVNNLVEVRDSIDGQAKGIEEFVYDNLNRVISLSQSGNDVTEKRVEMSYDAASQMTDVTRYAGGELVAKSDYTYDEAGRLTNLIHHRGENSLAEYSWVYDEVDRIIQLTNSDGTSQYNYDEIDQLVNANYNYQSDEDYSYDENGNRTNAGYVTGSNNRLLSDEIYNYEYDAEGNLIRQIEIATGIVEELSWDYRNRLTKVVLIDNNDNIIKSAEYTYDVFDRRIEKSVDPDGDGAATAEIERFVYDGDHIALVFDGDGNQTYRYLHGTQIDQILAQEANGEVLWALADNQGTVRDVVDSDGIVVNHITYDSFGRVTGETNPAVEFRFGYTGRELDAETGLYYYRARYYNPATGRFLSEDPIGFAARDANLYRYVGNSPTNYTDPQGTDLYDILNRSDQFAAGFGDAVTFGGTTWLREKAYGDRATKNHQGGWFTAGQVTGAGASLALGYGAEAQAAKLAPGLVKAIQIYDATGAVVDGYNGVKNIASGCSNWTDWLGLAPGVGALAGRAGKGLNKLDDDLKQIDNQICFVAGTKVLTPDGEKNIEDIKVGDEVIADDPTTQAEIETKKVLKLFSHTASELVDLVVDGEAISVTPDHRFWVVDKGWVKADDLEVGSLLQTEDRRVIDVDGVSKREGSFKVYNFEVEDFHTYFVSDHHILVHNDCVSVAKKFRAEFKRRGNLGDGKIITIKPAHGAFWLPEPPAGYPPDVDGWSFHDVFVKDGIVYDPMGWGERSPISFDEWISHYGDNVIVTDGPSRGK